MNFIYFIVGFVALFICYFIYTFIKYDFYGNDINYTSSIDGKTYKIRDMTVKNISDNVISNLKIDDSNDVSGKFEDNSMKVAANYLATIRTKMDNLVDYMREKELPDKEISERLYKRWKKCILRETSNNETAVAYTLNKGDEMRICIRSPEKFEDINTSIFVILHELAHLMSVSFDHTPEFKENFYYIVHLASRLGYYDPQDFTKDPVKYCGIEINTTPCSAGTCKTPV